jgi:hypothetical protein
LFKKGQHFKKNYIASERKLCSMKDHIHSYYHDYFFCIKWYTDINSTLTCFGYFIFVRPNNKGRQNCKHGSTLQINTTSTSLFWKPKFQYFNTICIILTRFTPISNIWRVIHSHQLHLTCFNTFFLFNLPLRAKQNSKHGSTLQVE